MTHRITFLFLITSYCIVVADPYAEWEKKNVSNGLQNGKLG